MTDIKNKIIAAVVLILAGLAWFFKRKSDKASTDAKLAETKGKDAILVQHQRDVEAAIASLDAGIEKMRKEKEVADRKREFDNLSLKERADRIKKGLE